MIGTAGWQVDGQEVYPLGDLREHEVGNPDCWCHPFYDGAVLVHNSMDRREEYERGRRVS